MRPPRALFLSLASANRISERRVKLRTLPSVLNPSLLSAGDLSSARGLHFGVLLHISCRNRLCCRIEQGSRLAHQVALVST